MVLQTNQRDHSFILCSLLEWYCMNIRQPCHIFYVLYCRQIKQTYHRHGAKYQNGIVDKSNRYIIHPLLTIKMVFQTNQSDLSYTLCSLLVRYCRQIKQTYHSHCVNYQSGTLDKSNRPIIHNVLTIRMVLQANQTDQSNTMY